MIRLVSVVGARPQFIKLGPIQRAIDALNGSGAGPCIEELVVHTGQHYDQALSQRFFDELELHVPELNLGVGSGAHGAQTGEMLRRLEEVFCAERPDIVVVYGDTNSTLAGALAASKLHIPVAHVEAGLRSFNRRMPEEQNRVVTDHLSEVLFCPTDTAVRNLGNEGIHNGVFLTGDVTGDSVRFNVELARARSKALERLELVRGEYVLATIHRAENTDDADRLAAILAALEALARDMPVVFPAHPRTVKAMQQASGSLDRVRVVEPLGYLAMLLLEEGARVIVTDSGGVQKEACLHGVPCVTVRDETEWVETVDSGWNILVGANKDRIVRTATDLPHRRGPSPYGKGDAAVRIVEIISKLNLPAAETHRAS